MLLLIVRGLAADSKYGPLPESPFGAGTFHLKDAFLWCNIIELSDKHACARFWVLHSAWQQTGPNRCNQMGGPWPFMKRGLFIGTHD
jgi:hypothetical protein